MTGQERLVSTWEEKPYVSHRRRGAVVEHRVRLIAYSDGNLDVVHDIRSEDDRTAVPEHWVEAEVYEVRGGRISKTRRRPLP